MPHIAQIGGGSGSKARDAVAALSLAAAVLAGCAAPDDAADSEPDGGTPICVSLKAYEVDVAGQCKRTAEPEADAGCSPCQQAECDSLASQTCYLSSDQSLMLLRDGLAEPDPFLADGWSYCDDAFQSADPWDLPLCEE